tara:strand:- start:320 stop:1114 length:795 start_codon:yes stop_codon:yes gene_type:complete
MYNKPAPLKATVGGRTTKPETKKPESKKFNPKGKLGSEYRRKEYDAGNKQYDDTIKGYNRDGTKIKPAATATPPKPKIKKDFVPTGRRATTTPKPPETIKKVTKEQSAENVRRAQATAADNKAKNAVEDADTARIARKKIADKARIAMNKKKAAAAGQTQNMKDKIKLKADIKTLRKNKKGNTTEKGDTKSNKDLLKEKRKEKRGKRKAIRKYKNNPNNMKVAKVKKDKKSKVNARTPSGNSGQAFVGEKPKKASATKMYKKKK